jgi:Na+/melibiose symporter-like transporter
MHTHKTCASSPWGRFKLIGAGLVFAGVGVLLLRRGVQVVMHWTGQPMFSWGFVAAGVVCFVLAFIPTSWVAKAAEIPRERQKR